MTMTCSIRLRQGHRKLLRHFLARETTTPAVLLKAEILLEMDRLARLGKDSDETIGRKMQVSPTTVRRLRKCYSAHGLSWTLFGPMPGKRPA